MGLEMWRVGNGVGDVESEIGDKFLKTGDVK